MALTNQQKLDYIYTELQPISRGGDKFSVNGKVPFRQEVADSKTLGQNNSKAISVLSGQVSALTNVVNQLLAKGSSPVDMAAVQAAAEAGANEALQSLRIVSADAPQ